MQTFKQRCIKLRKKDLSLIEIAKITGRPKTSVYVHIYNIPLSQKKLLQIKKVSGARIKKFSIARKGKSARSFTSFAQWTPETVLLVSHFLFDGGLSRSSCVYNNRSTALLLRVEKLMQNIYEFEPKRYINQKTGVSRISYYNVALALYLKEKSQELLSVINTLSSDLQREFLRAFFDDEGCMDFRVSGNRRKVRGYQKKTSVLFLVKKLLNKFEILAAVKKPNEVVITGKENLIKFQKEINFSPGVCINGNRSNSLWGSSLEKREILRRAIASFRT